MAQHETWVSSTCECPESNLDLVQPTWHSEYPISVTKQPSSGGKVSRTFRNHGGDCKRFCRHIRTSRGRHQVFAFAGLAAGPEIRLRLTGQSPKSSEKRSDQRVSVPQIQFSSLSSFTKGRVRTDSLEEIIYHLTGCSQQLTRSNVFSIVINRSGRVIIALSSVFKAVVQPACA